MANNDVNMGWGDAEEVPNGANGPSVISSRLSPKPLREKGHTSPIILTRSGACSDVSLCGGYRSLHPGTFAVAVAITGLSPSVPRCAALASESVHPGTFAVAVAITGLSPSVPRYAALASESATNALLDLHTSSTHELSRPPARAARQGRQTAAEGASARARRRQPADASACWRRPWSRALRRLPEAFASSTGSSSL